MKKAGIITIFDQDNYGNRLQNYAIKEILEKNYIESITLLNHPFLNTISKKNKIRFLLSRLKNNSKTILYGKLRNKRFKEFNKNIKITKKYFSVNNKEEYDYYLVGSDQVWNPTFGRLKDFDLATFTKSKNKISFSASFGISELPEQYKEKTAKALKEFKAISVREEAGKKIVEELTGRKDVEVLVDPTMLLTAKEWDKVSKKPEQLKTDKYILNYFLGELSAERRKEIDRIAKENGCEVINILDKKSPFYQTGPAEFLYLEKNAFLICTDSFHSCVFAILYNRPFIIFDREDNIVKMNSRIETLLSKLKLKNREFKGKITKENLEHNYQEAYELLEKEREKANKFLKKALELEEE